MSAEEGVFLVIADIGGTIATFAFRRLRWQLILHVWQAW